MDHPTARDGGAETKQKSNLASRVPREARLAGDEHKGSLSLVGTGQEGDRRGGYRLYQGQGERHW